MFGNYFFLNVNKCPFKFPAQIPKLFSSGTPVVQMIDFCEHFELIDYTILSAQRQIYYLKKPIGKKNKETMIIIQFNFENTYKQYK